MIRARYILVSLLAALTACAGSETQSVGSSFENDAAPLPTIERAAWEDAPAGCEGQLDFGLEVSFGIAEGAPELVVALREVSEGSRVVCVDSYASIESELELVDPPRLDGLWLGYVSALQEAEPFSADYAHNEAEPDSSPAPDLGAIVRTAEGDPHPEPSNIGDELPIDLDIAMGDPHPEPSDPADCEDPAGNAADAPGGGGI